MKILIIQILRIGDSLQLVPVIKGLKTYFPQARICLLTSRLGKAMLADHADVDEVYVLQKEAIIDHLEAEKPFRAAPAPLSDSLRDPLRDLLPDSPPDPLIKAVNQLESDLKPVRALKWDWVINFSYSFQSALLSFLLETQHRSGFTANDKRQYIARETWFAFSMASFMNRRYSNFNWVDINKEIVGLEQLPPPPYLEPPQRALAKAKETLRRLGLEGKRIVGFQPGASHEFKRWPEEKFTLLGKRLVNQWGNRILIFGGDKEHALGDRIAGAIGNGAHNLAGQTSLADLQALLFHCEVLVTNDTGPMHVAAAVGTRVIGLFFSTHFVETGPYGSGHTVVHPDIDCFPCQSTAECLHQKCLQHISPATVERLVIGENSSAYDTVTGAVDNGIKGDTTAGQERDRAYGSFFDPWGHLDWRPLQGTVIRLRDIERLLLKTAWLSVAGGQGVNKRDLEMYLTDMIGVQSAEPASFLTEKLRELAVRLGRMRRLFRDGCELVYQIQLQLIEVQPDTTLVEELGRQLKVIEETLAAYGGESPLAFLSELHTQFQENIEQSDPLRLATKTIAIYQDSLAMVESMIKQTAELVDRLSPPLASGESARVPDRQAANG